MISKEEVGRIAKLARLELTEKEIEKMQKDLSAILDYFDLLKKAPKPGKSKLTKQKSRTGFRIDQVVSCKEVDKIVKSFPDKKDNYIKVKSIL